MARIDNPRFPHHCRIIRYAKTEPMEDQSNVSDYDPMADEEIGDTDNTDLPEGVTVIYEGVCRSDNRDTISDNGDVIASYRTLSLPLKQNEWTEDTIPLC